MGRTVFWLVAAGLGLPALVLTVVRMADTDVGAMIRVQSFTPLAIPLYAALVLQMASAVLLWPAGQRSQPVTAALLAVAGLVLHAWWFAPQVIGDNPPPAAGAARITVMNANLFAGLGNAEDVVDAVRREHVDILVLEEVTPGVLEQLDAEGLAQLLPHRIGTPDRDVAGTMVFSNEEMGEPALLATEFHSYRVQVGSLTLLAVHPVAPVLPRAWRADHALILDEAVSAGADLIVGDLNATPDHDVMRRLDDAGFRDAGELANDGWRPTWPANHVGIVPLLPPLLQIDHVLLAPTLASLGTHTVDIQGTDHLALVATVARR
jgi:endonuclease/exonuclease/phosphatase family metal-dependent hydrolase